MLRLALALSSILVVLGHLAAIPALGQGSGDIREMKLRDWEPRSMLVTKATTVPKAKFPVDRRAQPPGRRQGHTHAANVSRSTSR